MNVLLLSLNRETKPAPVYPVALARLAGELTAAGHRAHQFDLLAHGEERLEEVLAKSAADAIGISIRNVDNLEYDSPFSYIGEIKRIAALIRMRTAAPIVLGGSGFSIFPEAFLHEIEARFGVVGAGETALLDVLEKIDQAPRENLIRKTSCSRPGDWSVLDGAPAAHDPEIVRYYWEKGGMIGVQTKRGCPRRCTYCSYPLIEGRGVEAFPAKHVADELEFLSTVLGVRYFFFVDSVFNLDAERETALAEEIVRRSLKISWGAFFSPAPIDGPYLKTLKRSGLTHLEFGTESLSRTMLEAYAKDFTVDQALEATALGREFKLHVAHYLLLGGPGETMDTLNETMENTLKMKECVFFPFAGVRIFPGTPLFFRARREGLVQDEMSCFKPVFYLSPDLDSATIWNTVKRYHNGAPNWILPSNYAGLDRTLRRMRARGMKGPLWEYAAASMRVPKEGHHG